LNRSGDARLSFTFEVRESDLLGRVGRIRVGGRSLETPSLLPVIHPADQTVHPAELKSMGFGGVMTNAYILGSRSREEAIRKGVHGFLGFDGAVMTDSGGYQALEYGDLGVGYGVVASFQADIGSDLAVTLDRPTGYPQERKYAKETVEYSLRNALATRKEFAGRETVWVGPVQGGLYADLVRRSASSLVEGGFEFLALGSPVQVMENYMFAELASMIIATRMVIPYSVPLHLFGAGHPLTMALAVALGCDTFDSASYVLFARKGRYMGRSGVTSLESMKFLPCSCEVCSKSSVKGLLELDPKERTRMLALHNLHVLRQEVEACREAIVEGRLWDLVRERSMAHPRLTEAFKVLAENAELLSLATPSIKERGLFVMGRADFDRPELVHARRKLSGVVRRSSGRASLALAEGVGSRSGTPKSNSNVDAYRLHPVLGPYPVELEFVYPFGQSVVANGVMPVMGPREAAAKLRAIGYNSVVVGKGVMDGRIRSRRSLRGASPSARSSSARPRSPPRP